MSSFHRFIMNVTLVATLIAGTYVAQELGAVGPAMAGGDGLAPTAVQTAAAAQG